MELDLEESLNDVIPNCCQVEDVVNEATRSQVDSLSIPFIFPVFQENSALDFVCDEAVSSSNTVQKKQNGCGKNRSLQPSL